MELTTLSPDAAIAMLETFRYSKQRQLNRQHVDRIRLAMEKGIWIEGGELVVAVVPPDEMFLIDGQHRLKAQSESGMALKWYVNHVKCESLDEAAKHYGNLGRLHSLRSAKDVIRARMKDFPYAESIPDSYKPKFYGAFSRMLGMRAGGSRAVSVEVIIAGWQQNKESVRKVAEAIAESPLDRREKGWMSSADRLFFPIVIARAGDGHQLVKDIYNGSASVSGLASTLRQLRLEPVDRQRGAGGNRWKYAYFIAQHLNWSRRNGGNQGNGHDGPRYGIRSDAKDITICGIRFSVSSTAGYPVISWKMVSDEEY